MFGGMGGRMVWGGIMGGIADADGITNDVC